MRFISKPLSMKCILNEVRIGAIAMAALDISTGVKRQAIWTK